ncbi:hypothetical protein KZZ52_27650 [Dactylosporangium sp. AC04546]|uniref:hypothetical protein n=1 Tax=Dactylosporangium sp. AC04546 TaxID=2862460 RepID=UPI001EDDD50D|nr:hypothetical protein [Dactylosporangium sp. AC04546]WVK89042.1 hypothetical protein KZZ52_27650 [Dactylosporangium sp. AC04546]
MRNRKLVLVAAAALLAVAGTTVAVLAGPPADAAATTIEDTDRGPGTGQVEFSAGWHKCTTTCSKAADRSYRWTNAPGATATVRFAGTRITLFGVKEPWAHLATVTIDGGRPEDVDFWASPATANVVQVYQSPPLTAGEHTLVLTMSERRNAASTGGDAITFDRAEITDGVVAPSSAATPSSTLPSTMTPTTAPTTAPTTVTPPTAGPRPGTAPVTGNRSGLTWASGYGGNTQTQARYDAFGTTRGRPLDVAKVFPVRSAGWDGLVGPGSFIHTNFAGFPGRLAIAVPLFPKDAGNLAQCAAGSYNAQWATFGATLVSKRRGDSIVQLGWEFNAGHYWHATDTAQWIQCFRNASTAIKSKAPQAMIDWTMNGHGVDRGICGDNAWNCYPGDAYVDSVGIHDYDHYPAAPTAAAFTARADGPYGLNTVHRFAVAHGKWMTVLEWGVNSEPGKPGGRDNPLYIQLQHDWFAAHDVDSGGRLIAEAYFDDDCAPGNVRSTLSAACGNGRSAALYNTLY